MCTATKDQSREAQRGRNVASAALMYATARSPPTGADGEIPEETPWSKQKQKDEEKEYGGKRVTPGSNNKDLAAAADSS